MSLHSPDYRPAAIGPWTLSLADLAGMRGYWGELHGLLKQVPILVGPGQIVALPLVLPDWPDYPEKIVAAARHWAPPGEWWRS